MILNLKCLDKISSMNSLTYEISFIEKGTIFKKEFIQENIFSEVTCLFENSKLKKIEKKFPTLGGQQIEEYENGLLIKSYSLDKFNCLSYESTYEYDRYNNKKSFIYKSYGNRGHTSSYVYTNEYDKNNHLKKVQCFVNNNYEYTKEMYHTPEGNHLTTVTRNKNNEVIYESQHFYNFFNQVYKSTGFELENNEKKRFNYSHKYNQNGDMLISEKFENDITRIYTNEYKYDLNQNWIELKQTLNGKIKYIERRSFFYK